MSNSKKKASPIGHSFNPDFTNGLIIGRFMPLHKGHCFLIESAQGLCKTLHVCICSTKADDICGSLRYSWLCERYASAIHQKKIIIHHVTKEIPEAHALNPAAPKIWAKEIKKIIKKNFDVVFASEDYGRSFSKHLGAYFFSIDQHRDIISISGQQIRKNPYAHWKYLPAVVRKSMVRIIALYTNRNEDFLQRCVKKLKATSYIPYQTRKVVSSQDTKTTYSKHMAVSELLALTHISQPIICVLLNNTNKNAPELSLCENTYTINTENQLEKQVPQIYKDLKTSVSFNVRV